MNSPVLKCNIIYIKRDVLKCRIRFPHSEATPCGFGIDPFVDGDDVGMLYDDVGPIHFVRRHSIIIVDSPWFDRGRRRPKCKGSSISTNCNVILHLQYQQQP